MAKIKASPTAARMITINHGTEKFDIIPNGKDSKFVEVPDEVLNQRFVELLVDSGDIIVQQSAKKAETEDKITDLRKEAQELGIHFDGRTSEATLQKKVDEAKAAK